MCSEMAVSGQSADIPGTLSRPAIPKSIATQRFDQPRLSGWQQFRERGEVTAASRSKLERGMHVDANHVPARREPQLPLARKQHLPGFMLLLADQGVLAVRAEPPVGSRLSSGAGQVVFPAGFAVLGPSTGLEVPAAEGPDPFFAAFSNTWRRVNS